MKKWIDVKNSLDKLNWIITLTWIEWHHISRVKTITTSRCNIACDDIKLNVINWYRSCWRSVSRRSFRRVLFITPVNHFFWYAANIYFWIFYGVFGSKNNCSYVSHEMERKTCDLESFHGIKFTRDNSSPSIENQWNVVDYNTRHGRQFRINFHLCFSVFKINNY